jgi:hypothetical protein
VREGIITNGTAARRHVITNGTAERTSFDVAKAPAVVVHVAPAQARKGRPPARILARVVPVGPNAENRPKALSRQRVTSLLVMFHVLFDEWHHMFCVISRMWKDYKSQGSKP